MRQIKLVPSGVSAWYRDTIAATHDCFAYSSTMALHIFRLRDNGLHRMIAAHERAITSICWCPQDSNLLASASISGQVIVWELDQEDKRHVAKVLASNGQPDAPTLMDWAFDGDKIALALESGEIRLWEYKEADKQTKLFSVSSSTSGGGAKVLRWHPRDSNRLMVGVGDGSLAIHDQRTPGKRVNIVGKSKTSKDAVTDAQWDPLSDLYLLVAFGDGSLVLYESQSGAEVIVFDKQAQVIKSLAWLTSQPGNFITTTERVGVLKIWNVSQKGPKDQIKVGSAGVMCIKAVPSEPNWFVLSFKNSAVGVCDVGTRTMRFTSSPGHSETIFDVVFHPEDPDILATASYDGYVKLWRVSSMESHRDMHAGKDQLLYGLAFGPRATRVCAVSSAGCLFIWKTETGEQLHRLQLHSGMAYRCEWNVKGRAEGTGEIVTGGSDGVACIVDSATGQVVRKLTHPDACIGVQWHPSQEGILATACKDRQVRIFNVSQAGPNEEPRPIAMLAGHDARVFNVAFHPICSELLASGSDDKTVRVWNWTQPKGSQEVRRLIGHTAYVRGLLWHSELPEILFSGSWDSTIRVWNVATSQCLHTSYEHHADVYGLTLHPKRPFFLVSSSRDTTLRFWIFEDQVRPMLAQAVVRPDRISELLGEGPEEALQLITQNTSAVPHRLFGQASSELVSTVQTLLHAGPPGLQLYQAVLSFFLYRHGLEDLWGMLAVIRGEPSPGAGPNRAMFHERELIQCQRSKALELASAKGIAGVFMKREDRLLKAAQIMLRIGDLRSYCQFVAQAGQWERAICIAPAVSHQFWVQMCNEYIDTLNATSEMGEVAPFWVATGKASKFIHACVDRSDLDTAFVVAKSQADGLLPGDSAGDADLAAPHAPAAPSGARERLEDVASTLAARYADEGEPVKAAMCFLAVSASDRAAATLSRSHEIILSYVVAELLQVPKEKIVVKLLSLCAERDKRWDLAADILRQLADGESLHIPLLASRIPDKAVARSIHAWTPEQHMERIEPSIAAGDMPTAVLSAVCAGERPQTASLGVQALYELFARPTGWTVPEARAIMDSLEALPLQDMEVKDIAGVLSCAAYVGLVEANSEGYADLMFPLGQTLKNIITHQDLPFPVTPAYISYIEALGSSQQNPESAAQMLNNLLAAPDTAADLRPLCEQQLAQIQSQPDISQMSLAPDGPGLRKLAGGNLPTGVKKAKISVLTNQIIRGPAFELDMATDKLHVSLADALAWVRVNAFSPLNTGGKIFPV